MGENSNIEWCDHTFNPWIGCTKVSPGCAHCYAEDMMDRRYGKVQWGRGHPRQRTSKDNWRKPLAWNRKAESDGVRYRVFCASLADVFDDEVPRQWREDLFDLIRQTPHLDWLLLTKRPQFMRGGIPFYEDSQLWPNVWLGTTVENQQSADERIPLLLEVPARVRFLSCEPLIGQVALQLDDIACRDADGRFIDWIICGGESGREARPMHPDWALSLRNECTHFGVPFFFKQWGEWAPDREHSDHRPSAYHNFDGGPLMARVGKKIAGRLLDGRTYDGLPFAQEPL